MQKTSALYKSIIATEPHWFETYITVNGNTVNEDEIFSLDRSRPGMSQNIPTVGGALASTLKLTMIYPSYDIPKMGEIKVFYRAKDATRTSEWLPAGTYYIDTRARNQSYNGIDTLTVEAFDAMMRAEADYPNTDHDWPYPDRGVVAEIAAQIGVTVDSRTYQFLTARYPVELPTGYVMREVLEHIAAANGGNFVITAENKLLFVPLYGLDPEEDLTGSYLAVEGSTDAITFGNEGWYILV